MTTIRRRQSQKSLLKSNKTYYQLIDIQDEINKIKHNHEVQQELTQTIATILHCINQNTTNPLYNHKTLRIPATEYPKIANQNQQIPAPLNFFLFQPNIQQEIHETLLRKIKHHQIQHLDHFMDEIFQQIFHSPQIPNLFQDYPQYKTLESYLEPLYQLYIQL